MQLSRGVFLSGSAALLAGCASGAGIVPIKSGNVTAGSQRVVDSIERLRSKKSSVIAINGSEISLNINGAPSLRVHNDGRSLRFVSPLATERFVIPRQFETDRYYRHIGSKTAIRVNSDASAVARAKNAVTMVRALPNGIEVRFNEAIDGFAISTPFLQHLLSGHSKLFENNAAALTLHPDFTSGVVQLSKKVDSQHKPAGQQRSLKMLPANTDCSGNATYINDDGQEVALDGGQADFSCLAVIGSTSNRYSVGITGGSGGPGGSGPDSYRPLPSGKNYSSCIVNIVAAAVSAFGLPAIWAVANGDADQVGYDTVSSALRYLGFDIAELGSIDEVAAALFFLFGEVFAMASMVALAAGVAGVLIECSGLF